MWSSGRGGAAWALWVAAALALALQLVAGGAGEPPPAHSVVQDHVNASAKTLGVAAAGGAAAPGARRLQEAAANASAANATNSSAGGGAAAAGGPGAAGAASEESLLDYVVETP